MRILSVFVLLVSVLFSYSCIPISLEVWQGESGGIDPDQDSVTPQKYIATNYENVKAMWLSQYDLLPVYTSRGAQRERGDFEEKISLVLDNIADMGINTIFVQVRPFGDSFYPSEIYPISSYVSGEYGRDICYDPFEIILKEAHRRGLSVHAWVNPLRLMRDDEILMIDGSYKIKQWYLDKLANGKYLSSVSGRFYLNPAEKEARELVCSGIAEILERYEVDGIHIDDYFYPTTDESFDSASYSEYLSRGGELSLADFRRSNINSLVKEIYKTVKSENESVLFGVSPGGVMKNNYNLLFADVAEWCRGEGYVDYLCPQLYFGFEHQTVPFDKLCHEFSAMVKSENIKLIFGLSLGKAESEFDQYAGSGKYEWRDCKDILYRQLKYTEKIKNCSGVAIFSYQHFYDSVSGARNQKTLDECEKMIPLLKTILWSGK